MTHPQKPEEGQRDIASFAVQYHTANSKHLQVSEQLEQVIDHGLFMGVSVERMMLLLKIEYDFLDLKLQAHNQDDL